MRDDQEYTLILVRHGESVWNAKNLFTGWTDVDLSEQGLEEARAAGRALANADFEIRAVFTSVLKRAIKTKQAMLDVMGLDWLPVYRSWRLNERHYGALQGLNKAQTTEVYGVQQVQLWRRSFDIRPPVLEPVDPRHPRHDRRYCEITDAELPAGESLSDTLWRLLPYWSSEIVPVLLEKQCVLIVAHGNSLRALVKMIEGISDEAIVDVNIPTGTPYVYICNKDLILERKYVINID